MKTVTKMAMAGAVALGMATSAYAGTVPSSGVSFTPNVNNSFSVIFDFSTPGMDAETAPFNIGFDFDLTIESVTGSNALVGYFVDDSAGRLTNETTCSGFSGIGNCDLIFVDEPDGKLIFSNLASGEYNFGIFGATIPSAGSLTFGVSKVSPVPLPAGGLLLLTGLGALAFKRRRKTA